MPEPFFVLATQNPIEMEGTYPLPEAQLDRFMFNVVIDYLPRGRRGRGRRAHDVRGQRATIEPLFTGEDVLAFHAARAQGAGRGGRRALRRAAAPRRRARGRRGDAGLRQRLGELGRRHACRAIPRPRRRRRARCCTAARTSPGDIRALAVPVLRHRVLVNYRAEAEGISVEKVVARLVEHVKTEVQEIA